MIEDLYEIAEGAREELKRADHSLYVSLKYTRTVDIMKAIIKRLINAFDLASLELLEFLKIKKKIKHVPAITLQRAELVKEKFKHLSEHIQFYFFLRSIDKAEYAKREEYRKNVTLIAFVDGKRLEINVEKLHNFYQKTAEYVTLVEELVQFGGKKRE